MYSKSADHDFFELRRIISDFLILHFKSFIQSEKYMPVFSFPCFLSLSFDLELAITNNKVGGRRMFWDQTAGIYD